MDKDEEYHERRSDFKNDIARRALNNIYNRQHAMLHERWSQHMERTYGGGTGGSGGAQGGAVSSSILLPKQKE
jgi:hypothetical protein